jgi:DNA-binding NarL/FixJ family response regulator
VDAGTTPISPQAANALVAQADSGRRQPPLSVREMEVLRLIAQGMTNKEIGAELGLGVRTIETHRENLIRKTGLATVAELTRYAVAQGFVELNPAR